MLVQYFNFLRDPFGTTPDSRYLYPSQTHREAMASLALGFLNNRGFTALISPPGMGKTTLLFRFLHDIRQSACNVFLFDIDSECAPRDFVSYILRDLGIIPGKSSAEMHEQLTEALVKENRAGRKFVVVIDEAQNLSHAVLERVRLLTNFETSTGKLMQIVLSGQPQLSEKLMQPSLVQLRQRISTICRLKPLSIEETVSYIDYRLKQAGYDGGPLFSRNALELIAEASQGIPRSINNLCFNALSLCCALKGKQVDESMVNEVIADLDLIPQVREPVAAIRHDGADQPDESNLSRRTKRRLNSWIPATAVFLVLSALGFVRLTGLWVPSTAEAAGDRALDRKAPPGPTAIDKGEAGAAGTAQASAPFAITVRPDQTLHDISERYLGGFDPNRLHQIQALNPKLIDPDHIETGQTILLPVHLREPVATNATTLVSERKHP